MRVQIMPTAASIIRSSGAIICCLLLASIWSATAQIDERAQSAVSVKELASMCELHGLAASPSAPLLAVEERCPDLDANTINVKLLIFDAQRGSLLDKIDVDGSPLIARTPERQPNGAIITRPPLWSADGARLAYLKAQTGSDEIWVYNVVDQSSRRIVSADRIIDSLQWSQTSDTLAFRRTVSVFPKGLQLGSTIVRAHSTTDHGVRWTMFPHRSFGRLWRFPSLRPITAGRRSLTEHGGNGRVQRSRRSVHV